MIRIDWGTTLSLSSKRDFSRMWMEQKITTRRDQGEIAMMGLVGLIGQRQKGLDEMEAKYPAT